MGRMMMTAVAALALVGCNGDKDNTGTDTGAGTGAKAALR